MNKEMFLVDNNALVALKSDRIRSDFFHDFCRLTADVLWEAGDHPEQSVLSASVMEMTAALLSQLRTVMRTIAPGDVGLLDLYKNKGAADPGLIATMLEVASADAAMFFPDTWTLVTNDHAVEEKAIALNVRTIKPGELARRIDLSMNS